MGDTCPGLPRSFEGHSGGILAPTSRKGGAVNTSRALSRNRRILVCALPVFFFSGGALLAGEDRVKLLTDEVTDATAVADDTEESLLGGVPREQCMLCHGHIENAVENMRIGHALGCVFCHGGNPNSTVKETAHVQPSLPVINNQTTPPLDYDLPYQRFVNPSNLRVVRDVCGECHVEKVAAVTMSMMATAAGHYAGGLYQNNVVNTKTPIYGTFEVEDRDGYVPTELGAVGFLEDLLIYDPDNDPSLISTHFQAVPSQACARCHLWSRGKGYRGAEGADGVYRADGCAACHMPYANDGRSRSADDSIDHTEPGHPIVHTITKAVPTEQCLHCHHRGARIGLSYTGRAQMPPDLPSGPGVPGTTDVIFNSNYHFADLETNPEDIHGELGMHCIDCHTGEEVMGDGNIYGHMDQATKIECQSCHGTPTQEASLQDNDGRPLWNLRRDPDGDVFLISKVPKPTAREILTDRSRPVVQAMEIVDPASPRYNSTAACAMNDDHIKDEGGLECHACHTSWTANCFGCHFERDEREMGLNLITGQMEVGRASTNNKIFESLKYFMMGPNKWGKIAPYIVGCQPIADVTAPDGSKILDFAMPYTANGLSGLALQPVNPHTVRGAGEVRSCAECHRSPPTLGFGSGSYAIGRRHAFVVGDAGVLVFDRNTDPDAPTRVGTLGTTEPLALEIFPNVIEGTADFLYLARGPAGLDIYDLREGLPDGPTTVVPGVNAIDVSRAARYLYVVHEGVGVKIYDNADPVVAQQVATVPIPTALKAVPWGIHLFVAAGSAGLVVVDISDHDAPFIAGSLPGIEAEDVRLYAHYQNGTAFAARAYVADPSYGVRVVDLLPDFDAPTLAGGLLLPGAVALDTYTRYVPAHDDVPSREHDYLYVAAGTGGLHVYDITTPDDIVAVAALNLGGSADDLDVASQMTPPGVDDYALVANGTLGLQVIDVSDPHDPSLLTTADAAGAARVLVEVQQMDRFIDEQGNTLKENSHPGVGTLSREQIVRILAADIAVEEACQ